MELSNLFYIFAMFELVDIKAKSKGGESPPAQTMGLKINALLWHTHNFTNIMLNLEQCEWILNKRGSEYTRDQIKEIREFLYFIGELEFENNYININSNEYNNILPS